MLDKLRNYLFPQLVQSLIIQIIHEHTYKILQIPTYASVCDINTIFANQLSRFFVGEITSAISFY